MAECEPPDGSGAARSEVERIEWAKQQKQAANARHRARKRVRGAEESACQGAHAWPALSMDHACLAASPHGLALQHALPLLSMLSCLPAFPPATLPQAEQEATERGIMQSAVQLAAAQGERARLLCEQAALEGLLAYQADAVDALHQATLAETLDGTHTFAAATHAAAAGQAEGCGAAGPASTPLVPPPVFLELLSVPATGSADSQAPTEGTDASRFSRHDLKHTPSMSWFSPEDDCASPAQSSLGSGGAGSGAGAANCGGSSGSPAAAASSGGGEAQGLLRNRSGGAFANEPLSAVEWATETLQGLQLRADTDAQALSSAAAAGGVPQVSSLKAGSQVLAVVHQLLQDASVRLAEQFRPALWQKR